MIEDETTATCDCLGRGNSNNNNSWETMTIDEFYSKTRDSFVIEVAAKLVTEAVIEIETVAERY